MRPKDELEQLIKEHDTLLHANLLNTVDQLSNDSYKLPPTINDIVTNKAKLINELDTNINMAKRVKYEVEKGQKINTFIRLEGITNRAVIYDFIKGDKDFKSISSKVAYGSYKTLNMNLAFLKLINDTFNRFGY